MFNENQTSFFLNDETTLNKQKIIIKDIIIDRKSKYTLTAIKIEKKEDTQTFFKELLKDDYYKKATHNSYAYRIKLENSSILEWKNDDWETWAWMCILREIQRENWINMLIIVTRYFWWIKLQTDRFKNVIDACKIFFEKLKKDEI